MVDLKKQAGKGFTFEELKAAVEQHKPAVLFLCQVRHGTSYSIISWIQALSHVHIARLRWIFAVASRVLCSCCPASSYSQQIEGMDWRACGKLGALKTS